MAEAAGLVLGGIPIAAAGVKMILEGVSAGDRYLKYRLPLQTLHNQLLSEQTMYLNMCEELLNGVVDDDQKETLLQEPYGDAWKTPQVEASLKARLSRSYSIFEASVKNMQNSIAKINALLKVDDQGKININAANKFEKEYKRLKFSIKPSKYDRYVTQLRQDNLALMTMLGQNLRLEASRASKIKKVPDFSSIQRCASSIFSMICSGFQCTCRASHAINLLLEVRSVPQQGHCKQPNPPTFHLAFSYSCRNKQPEQAAPWELEAAEVRMAEAANSLLEATIPPGPAKKSVRFNIHNHHHQYHHQSNKSSNNTICPIPPPLNQTKLIANLCEELRRCQKWGQGACIGFLKCPKTFQRLDIFAPASPASRSNTQALSSLHQILREPTGEDRPRFSRLKRLRVAVTLASNLLQLHSTPWIKDTWGGEDIRFLDTTDGDSYEKAFISQRITSEGEVQARGATFDGFIRNRPLFYLGILLIELCLNKPFERLREEVQRRHGETRIPDYLAADQLLSVVSEEGSTTYATAVARCIRCNFGTLPLSLENEGFRDAVYKGVVSPLEEDLSNSLRSPG